MLVGLGEASCKRNKICELSTGRKRKTAEKALYDLVSDWTGMSNEALAKVCLIFISYHSC